MLFEKASHQMVLNSEVIQNDMHLPLRGGDPSRKLTNPWPGSFPISTTVNLTNPLLMWTNQSAAATVTRAAEWSFTWSGGGLGSFVAMGGSSSTAAMGSAPATSCIAPASAGQFTVPLHITLALPAGAGTSSIESSTGVTTFAASGLDIGLAFG